MQTTITVTLGEINDFHQAAKNYLNDKNLRPSHLSQAISKELKLLKSHIDDYDDAIAETRIDLAHKDKDGIIEVNMNGTYKMKADAAKKMQSVVRSIRDKEVQITPYYAKTVPKNLGLPWYEYFIPFVIADYPEPEEDTPEKE